MGRRKMGLDIGQLGARGMNGRIGVTDNDSFAFLSRVPGPDPASEFDSPSPLVRS